MNGYTVLLQLLASATALTTSDTTAIGIQDQRYCHTMLTPEPTHAAPILPLAYLVWLHCDHCPG